MNIKEIAAQIMDEIDAATQYTDEDTLIKVFATIHGANRIFFHANGRNMLTIKYFAQRLMHQGYRVFVVGDVATPAIKEDDVLVDVYKRQAWRGRGAFAQRSGGKRAALQGYPGAAARI